MYMHMHNNCLKSGLVTNKLLYSTSVPGFSYVSIPVTVLHEHAHPICNVPFHNSLF